MGEGKMGRAVLRGLALLALGSLSVEALAQDTPRWWDIACVHSKISVPAGLRCRTTQNFAGGQSGWNADAEGTFRQWQAFGAVGGVQYLYNLTEATSLGASIGPSATLQDGIRFELARGQEAKDFSALTNRGGVDFMTFTAASGDSCVGIRRYGPSMGAEYGWILNAVRCEPRGRPTSDAEIDRFIAGATARSS
jgi:hypothetical protein